jgi:hypothetical protein
MAMQAQKIPPASATAAPAPAVRKPPGRTKLAARLSVVPRTPEELLAQQVDELGALEAEIVQVRPKLVRVKTLRRLIREHFEGRPPAEAFEARGARYLATIGPRAFERSIDHPKTVKALGLKAYAAIAQPTLAALADAVAPHVFAEIVTQDYTGARPLKTFDLAVQQSAPKG